MKTLLRSNFFLAKNPRSSGRRLTFFPASLCAFALLASSCATVPHEEVYKGSYFHNFETSSFTSAGSNEAWCVNSAQMSKVTEAIGSSGRANVVLKGRLGPRGSYCNLGAYKYVLDVTEVISVDDVQRE